MACSTKYKLLEMAKNESLFLETIARERFSIHV